MNPRCKLVVQGLAAAALVLTAAPPVHAESVLRIVMNSDLKILDPIWNTAFVIRDHGYMVYDTLFANDADGEIKPQMVDRTEISPDQLTYTFTLRQGLAWHDGQPVTAEDCVASIKRWGARDTVGQKLMSFVAALRAKDAGTIELQLKEPANLVLTALGKANSNVPFMMPKRVADTDPFTQITDPTGSGPFIFKRDEWRPGHKAVYVRNPNYKPRPEPVSRLGSSSQRMTASPYPDGNRPASRVLASAPAAALRCSMVSFKSPPAGLSSWLTVISPFGFCSDMLPLLAHCAE
jgi:peptide/nickel transport system substrate-binding protein